MSETFAIVRHAARGTWTGHLEQCDLTQMHLIFLWTMPHALSKKRLKLNYIKRISDDILITPHPADLIMMMVMIDNLVRGSISDLRLSTP
jgi:hypothetical protein